MKSIQLFKVAVLLIAISLCQSFTTPVENNTPTEVCVDEELVDEWTVLGRRTVKASLDRDVIDVTVGRGLFKKMKFTVKNAPIHFEKMIVHYGNGSVWEHAIRHNIAAGSETRVIDLPGNKRIIKKVVFYYKKGTWTARTPVVTLWGRH